MAQIALGCAIGLLVGVYGGMMRWPLLFTIAMGLALYFVAALAFL